LDTIKYFDVGTKVKININYLKEYLYPGEFESHKDYNVFGTVLKMYFIDEVDFYEILWDDGKKESGFNYAFLCEVCDANELMKELLYDTWT